MTDRCALCKYFVLPSPSAPANTPPTCHALPPTPVVVPNGAGGVAVAGIFPGVDPADWCGKFALDLAAK